MMYSRRLHTICVFMFISALCEVSCFFFTAAAYDGFKIYDLLGQFKRNILMCELTLCVSFIGLKDFGVSL